MKLIPLIEGVFQEAVVRSLHDVEAEVERVSHRIKPQPLRGFDRLELEKRRRPEVCFDESEIVRNVNIEYVHGDRLIILIDVAPDVSIRMLHDLCDHVVVGDEVTGVADEETGTYRGFRFRARLLNLDLDDAIRKPAEHVLGGKTLRRRRRRR